VKFWDFKAKDADTGELTLYGEISEYSWYGDEVTPAQFKKDLDALGDIKTLDIYINSGGGDAFAGQAIYSTLHRHPAHKTVYIDGLAASAASVIAMAGDKIIMPANAMLMIHNAWTFTRGDKAHIRKVADTLEQVDKTLISVYTARTALPEDEISAMMDAETWLSAAEAVEKGFADEVEQGKKVAASLHDGILMLNSQQIDLKRYKKAPDIEEYAPEAPKNTDNGGETPARADKALQEQKLRIQKTKSKILKLYGGIN
jgi:ATP-dependent Clp protease protease subunit